MARMRNLDVPEDVDATAESLIEIYQPRERGKDPAIARAASIHLGYILNGYRKDERPSKPDLAGSFYCSAGSIANHEKEILSNVDVEVTVSPTQDGR